MCVCVSWIAPSISHGLVMSYGHKDLQAELSWDLTFMYTILQIVILYEKYQADRQDCQL